MKEHSIVLIDGKRVDGTFKEICVNLLYQIDIKHSRLEVIKENLIAIWDIIEEHLRTERELLKGQERAKTTRLLTMIASQRKTWLKFESYEDIAKAYYNYILSLE